VDFFFNAILDFLSSAMLHAFDTVVVVVNHILLLSPDVTGLPQVQALTGKTTWVVDSVFVLVFLAIGALTMASGGNERSRYTAKDLLARAVVGFIAAHFSQLVCGQAITLANALTLGLTSGNFLNPDAMAAMKSHLSSQNQASQLLFVIIMSLAAFLMTATAFQALTRLGVLLVLTAVAPIALACHALPQTDPVARLWWKAYAGCLAIPILQAFTVYAGEWMLLDPRNLLPELPVAGDPGSFVNLLIVVVLLWMAVKIPGLARRYITTGGGRSPNPLATIVRVVLVQQVTKAIPGLSHGAKAAKAAKAVAR
jgi:hypothetical protein